MVPFDQTLHASVGRTIKGDLERSAGSSRSDFSAELFPIMRMIRLLLHRRFGTGFRKLFDSCLGVGLREPLLDRLGSCID